MKVKQLSVFLENKPGALRRPVELLGQGQFNILALSLADTQQFGILRFIVKEWEKAMAMLEKEGFVVKVTDMVALEVSNAPGGLAAILSALDRAKVNLEYMYGFTQLKEAKGLLVFRFDYPDRAIETLQKHGINPVRRVEVFAAA